MLRTIGRRAPTLYSYSLRNGFAEFGSYSKSIMDVLHIHRLIAEPEQAVERQAVRLGFPPAPLSRRRQRCKRPVGKSSEMLKRLTGKEPTEVEMRYRKNCSHRDQVGERLANLYARPSMWSIN